MSLASRLSASIRECHSRIEELPIARAMAEGRITGGQYRSLLEQLLHVHLPLEAALQAQEGLRDLYQPGMARAGDLQEDLRVLHGQLRLSVPGPGTRALIERIQKDWALRRAALAGCLYVLEGSRLGSQVLAGSLASALGVAPLPGQGLDYHIRNREQLMVSWRRFKSTLDALDWAPAEREEVVGAAVETMQALYTIYAWLGDPVACEHDAIRPSLYQPAGGNA